MNRMLVAGAALALIGLAGCGSTSAGKGSTTSSTSSTPSASPSPSCDATCQAIRSVEASAATAAPSPTDSYMTPTRSDFTVTLKILSKQCFGSAGCNIEYQPKLSTDLASGLLDPTVTYDVTYVVRGDQSGPITDTIQVTGDQYSVPSSNLAQTAGESTKLTVTVTDVEPE